ncbi:CoA transferase [Aeromicrobium sp. UC242_57]|uniref:CoA transferase n=1 Tax=Aeromicrobium sp. UC242_57 TaxID=3374624 RepID=UPI00378DC7BD
MGAVIDSSIVDGVTSLTTATVGMAAAGLWGDRGQNAFDGSRPWYRTYATRDGGYMAVGAVEDKFYVALLQVLGLDPADWIRSDDLDPAALTRTLEGAFVTKDRDTWTEKFANVDACVSPVLTFQEAQASAAATSRSAYVDIDGVVQPAPLPRWVGVDAEAPAAPPGNGRDTSEVLRQIGFAPAEIRRLQYAGIVAGEPDDQ